MKTIALTITSYILVLSGCLLFSGILKAEEQPSYAFQIKNLNDPDWNVRNQAVWKLKEFISQAEVRDALIALLERENSRIEEWWKAYQKNPELPPLSDEGYAEYYLDILRVVGTIKDPKVLPALVAASNSSSVIREAISTFGSSAVAPLANALETSVNPEVAIGVANTVILLSDKGALSGEQKQLLTKKILTHLNSTDPFVRKSCISALVKIGDASVIPVLESLKNSDPYEHKQEIEGQIVVSYPVRDEAAHAIGSLKK